MCASLSAKRSVYSQKRLKDTGYIIEKWYTIQVTFISKELNQKLTEMGDNSWVKNLPVRPLAPRRKTPGQLYPINSGPPGKTN